MKTKLLRKTLKSTNVFKSSTNCGQKNSLLFLSLSRCILLLIALLLVVNDYLCVLVLLLM